MQNAFKLTWPLLATLVVPLIVAYFIYPNHVPPEFLVFPPVEIGGKPGFNLLYFLVVAAAALVITALFLFPKWFGFQGGNVATTSVSKRKLPWWFYLGLVLNVFFWWMMWTGSFILGDVIYIAYTPMFWGLILLLDGLVYFRTGGKSYAATRPSLLIVSGIFSMFAWAYFEYFDYFVLSNWYYEDVPPFSQLTVIAIFFLAYSTVWPVVFEWYALLNTFPKFVARYQNGPKVKLNGTVLIILGVIVTAGFTAFPNFMFWGVWIGPMAVVLGQLIRMNIWTPVADMAQGNWSPALLVALGTMLNGFLWELWNHGSKVLPDVTPNPNIIWLYDIPYVNVIHLFSEMPLLGYFGYLPFGLFVWIMYIWGGKLFGWRTDLDLT